MLDYFTEDKKKEILKIEKTIDELNVKKTKLIEEINTILATPQQPIELTEKRHIFIEVRSGKTVYYNQYYGEIPKFILQNKVLYHLGYHTGRLGRCYNFNDYKKKNPINNIELLKKIHEITRDSTYIGERSYIGEKNSSLICEYDE